MVPLFVCWNLVTGSAVAVRSRHCEYPPGAHERRRYVLYAVLSAVCLTHPTIPPRNGQKLQAVVHGDGFCTTEVNSGLAIDAEMQRNTANIWTLMTSHRGSTRADTQGNLVALPGAKPTFLSVATVPRSLAASLVLAVQ